MPPSGFSQKAINGLLIFVKSSYQITLKKYEETEKKSEREFLEETVIFLEKKVKEIIKETPLLVSNDAVQGLTEFVTSCYEDLIKEIEVGKDKYDRAVIEGKAMDKEIKQIEKYLEKFKL